ncbi:hypothetical protein CaCOL14_000171 [Colletotrichum acutatum]
MSSTLFFIPSYTFLNNHTPQTTTIPDTMSTTEAKQAFQAQLDLIASGMLAAGLTGHEAAQKATDAICRTWAKANKDAPDEEFALPYVEAFG